MATRVSYDVEGMTVYYDGMQIYEYYCKECGDLRHTSYGLLGKAFDPEFVGKVTNHISKDGCYACKNLCGVRIHRLSMQT